MNNTLIRFLLAASAARNRNRNDEGQSTAEYALVLLGAAAIALALISWVSSTDLVEKLFDFVFGGLFKAARGK